MGKGNSIAKILVTMVLAITMLGISSVLQAEQTKPIIIKVGLPTALSGPAAAWGQAGSEAYRTWIELFNKEGFKVAGKTYNFKLIELDDQNTPQGGAAAVKNLIYRDGCKFIAGHWTWNFPAIAAVTNPAKVILLTRSGNDALPGGAYNPKTMPYVVFANPSQEQFTSDVFALIKAFPKYKKIGLLDCTIGKGMGWHMVAKALDKAGVRYHNEWFPFGTTNFAPYVTRFAEAGCDIVYVAGWVGEAMMFAKQRWEMGHREMRVGHAGPFVNLKMYDAVSGHDAAQGFIGQYWADWDLKETKVDPKYVAMCKEVMKILSEKHGKPFMYTGWIGWLPSHLLILSQAMQKAGTVDDTDAIMKAIRGGTFSTTTGTYTMSGAKTYGSPVVFGTPGALSEIKGDKEVYLSENTLKPLP